MSTRQGGDLLGEPRTRGGGSKKRSRRIARQAVQRGREEGFAFYLRTTTKENHKRTEKTRLFQGATSLWEIDTSSSTTGGLGRNGIREVEQRVVKVGNSSSEVVQKMLGES